MIDAVTLLDHAGLFVNAGVDNVDQAAEAALRGLGVVDGVPFALDDLNVLHSAAIQSASS